MIVVLSNGDNHEIKITRRHGKFMAYIEVLGFHAYGFTEAEAVDSLMEICKPYIKGSLSSEVAK